MHIDLPVSSTGSHLVCPDHLLKLAFLQYAFFLLLCEKQNQVSIGAWVYVWVFSLIQLVNMSFQYAFIATALQYNLKLGLVTSPAVLLLFRIVLAILVFNFYIVTGSQDLTRHSDLSTINSVMEVPSRP